jgi:hypothetical protein
VPTAASNPISTLTRKTHRHPQQQRQTRLHQRGCADGLSHSETHEPPQTGTEHTRRWRGRTQPDLGQGSDGVGEVSALIGEASFGVNQRGTLTSMSGFAVEALRTRRGELRHG